MPTTTVYRSSDASAPTLSGTAGDLVNLLDKCLCTGYGSKAAAGWTKPYTGTNKAVFRAGGGNQFYLDVDDSAPVTAKEARVRGYETMSAVATGTGPFPTVAQFTNGLFVRKSTTADATTRSWILVADDRTFYLFVQTGDSAGVYLSFAFGDFYSVLAGDGYRTILIARVTENSATVTQSVEAMAAVSSTLTNVVIGHYVARSYLGTGGSLQVAKCQSSEGSNAGAFGIGNIPYPNGPDQSIQLSPAKIGESYNYRGNLRGLWCWNHVVSGVADGDTFNGAGDFAGRTFMIIKSTGAAGVFVVETSSTWDTSS